MKDISPTTPLVCNPYGIPSNQRESHSKLTVTLFQLVQATHELDSGFTFEFILESSVILSLAEFIANERLCCPFLNFALEVEAQKPTMKLTLSGPQGTKEFLRAELPMQQPSN